MQLSNSNAFYNTNAERSLLSAMIFSSKAAHNAATQLTGSDFTAPLHQAIFNAIVSLDIAKSPIDLVTIESMLTERGEIGLVGMEQLIGVAEFAPSSANAGKYMELVKVASLRRQLYSAAQSIQALSGDMELEAGAAVEQAKDMLSKLTMTGSIDKSSDLQDVLLKTYTHIEKLANGEIEPLNIAIPDIDNATGGLFGGEMTVIGARPGVGKSSLGIYIALGVAAHKKNVLFISTEMSKEQIGMRILACLSGPPDVPINAMRTPKHLTDRDWEGIATGLQHGSQLPVIIDDSVCTPQAIRALCNSIILSGKKLDLVMVDYLQQIKPGKKCENRNNEIGHVSRELKCLAKELNIPFVVMSQLNRESANKRPQLDKLRDSGSIEQDADNVWLIHEPEEGDEKLPESKAIASRIRDKKLRFIELYIEKQRQGSVGMTPLCFNPGLCRYTCIDPNKTE